MAAVGGLSDPVPSAHWWQLTGIHLRKKEEKRPINRADTQTKAFRAVGWSESDPEGARSVQKGGDAQCQDR